MPVFFNSEEINFVLNKQEVCTEWIEIIVKSKKKSLGNLTFIFTSNDYLLKINNKYLNHNYFTDVITFNYNEGNIISGDIFVSIDQVEINSKEYENGFESELFRVIVHGVLHLLGYNDSKEVESIEMRKEENIALKLLEDLLDEDKI